MDKDPSEMSDEELKAASGAQPEETPTNEESPADPPVEETPKEEPKEDSAPAEEAPAETPAEPEPEETPAPSRREQLRVQQLLKKYGPPPAEEPAPSQTPAPSTAPNFRELIDADDAVYDALDKTTAEAVEQARKAGETDTLKVIKSVQWETLLQIDTPQVLSKYPALNPNDKEHFRPALADAMNRRYMAMVGFDPKTRTVETPDIRYLDFVESEFELADEIASTQVANTTKNIAKQAANTGLRPDGSAAKGMDLSKHPEDMTNEELNAVINANMPRDARGRFTRT